jgi:hypothetical protein
VGILIVGFFKTRQYFKNMNKVAEYSLAEHEVIFREANIYIANFIEGDD